MTSDRRFERDLPDLLAELAPRATPDYRDDIVRQTAHMRQRPAWMFPERWLPMSVITTRAVAAPPIRWRVVGLVALLLLALAVGLVVVAGSQRHLPAPFGPAANGLVAYSKAGDIYTVDPNNGARRAIVTGEATDESPAFSRDGTRLAFLRAQDAGSVVVLADADGRNQVAVQMTPLADVQSPGWSPDGRWIAVPASDGGTSALWIVDTVALTARKTDGLVLDDGALYWRPPDGRQLAVVAQVFGGLRIALVSPAGDGLAYLPPVGYAGGQFREGGWAPDGSRFVYASDPPWGQIHVIDVVGGQDVQIQPSMSGNDAIYPLLSNDGRRVLFMEQGPAGKSWLSVAPSDGSKPAIRVSDPYPDGIGLHYSWSPDDSMIEFEPNVGPHVLLDPGGGPTSTPPWITEGAESWQRLAR